MFIRNVDFPPHILCNSYYSSFLSKGHSVVIKWTYLPGYRTQLWFVKLKSLPFPFIFTEFYVCVVWSMQCVSINWISAVKLCFMSNKYDTRNSSCLSGMTQLMEDRNPFIILEAGNNENCTFHDRSKLKKSKCVASGVDNQWNKSIQNFLSFVLIFSLAVSK